MIENLTDEELEARLQEALGQERDRLADFLEHLVEFDDRRLGHRRAYGSTFDYCTRKLALSQDEAYKRIQVMRAAKSHRRLLEMIRSGTLSLTAAVRIAPHLNDRPDLMAWAIGKSTRDIEIRVATLSKVAARAREIVEFVSAPVPGQGPASTLGVSSAAPGNSFVLNADATCSDAPAAGDWEVRLHFTANKRLFEKLERAKDLSRHRRPDGTIEEIVEDALDALLVDIDRGLKERPAPEREVLPRRRRIPEWVKDAVWKRDGGKCAYEADGRRCESTAWLEYDHVEAFARGGPSDDPANVRLLCRAHNQLVAQPSIDKVSRPE